MPAAAIAAALAFCASLGAEAQNADQKIVLTLHKKKHRAHVAHPHVTQPQASAAPAPAMSQTDDLDMSRAIPLDQTGALPSTGERYKELQNEIQKNRPAVQSAKQKSDALTAEADNLRKRLVDTAARVQNLEAEKGSLDAAITELMIEQGQMKADFERDRVKVGRLLAVLERLQHDMPPVIVLKTDDALGATHGAMLLGASLPRIYGAAAELERRMEELQRTHLELQRRRLDSTANAKKLLAARGDLDQLLAIKEHEALTAEGVYSDLQSQLDTIAGEAADLGSLITKVAALRASTPVDQTVTVVGSSVSPASSSLRADSLRRPVVGRIVPDKTGGSGANMSPGVTFETQPGATVVAPTDGRVLFAGRYHKSGQVLILEISGGYDLVLAGLDSVAARAGDQLLAGEPLGTMPHDGNSERLYFEVRQNGKGVSPAPWLEVDLRKANRS